jgi:hypothetical protein
LHDSGEAGQERSLEPTIVDGVNEIGGRCEMHLGKHELGEPGCWSTAIEGPHDNRKRRATNPVPTAFVAKQVTPASGATRAF